MNQEEFNQLVTQDRIVLFMKGTPDSPQCGFSAQVVFILRDLNVDFTPVNVFEVDKEELKEFSNWPTFPQLWVDGKLIGGCDIVSEMAHTGDLEKTLTKS